MQCVDPLISMHKDIDGLVQDDGNSIANALELLQSCTKPLTWCIYGNVLMRIYACYDTSPKLCKIGSNKLIWIWNLNYHLECHREINSSEAMLITGLCNQPSQHHNQSVCQQQQWNRKSWHGRIYHHWMCGWKSVGCPPETVKKFNKTWDGWKTKC